MKEYGTLLIEEKENYIIVKINRPEALNALNEDLLKDLKDLCWRIKEDTSIRVVILTGEGRSFVAGADVKAMNEMNADEGRSFMLRGQAVMKMIENLEIPVIAAVNGFAIGGGCELAMACDIRFASEKAKFGQPEVSLGIIPGFGGTQRLAALTSKGMAKYLIFSGETINAEEALRIGLVERVFPPEDLLDKAIALAESIINNSPKAIEMAKVAINNSAETNLSAGIAFEAEAMTIAFMSKEKKDRMDAFCNK